MMFASKKIRDLTRAALLLAVLLVLQFATKSFGQFVSGSCVNAVLAIASGMVSLPYAICIAVLSPFAAFLFGIGPQLFPLTFVIALGNSVYVILLRLLWKKSSYLAAASAAVVKFLVLYLLVVQLLCKFFAPKAQMLTAMFSWPQLVTALIGGAIALIILPLLQKADSHQK